ncbi:PREDICTED: connectin-like isoform X1 [Nicrophorus vespilloides]|uniref:Connectin-like isoform X1 n=2 Tax=Nicrophorus vespilloides TaxID=110193 RepID=A0ABM1MKI5_NICVS|nr:PREDICTED: connectin-like isoform X1 [Nicrophorus vespilloides]
MIVLEIILYVIFGFYVTCGMNKVCNSNTCGYVNCYNGNFTTFGDWKCTNIHYLNFISNNIRISELRKLTCYKIIKVELSRNNISNLPNFVFNGTQIDQLFLDNNNISKISTNTFHGMSALTDISLKHNSIKLIDPQSIPKAWIVELSNNLLETIDANMFVNISYVKHLILDNNYIKRINEKSFKGFIGFNIYLNFNKLQYLGVKSVPAVERLSLRGNQLLDINQNVFVNITKLSYIDVSLNCIQKLNVLLINKYFWKNSIQFDNCSSVDIEGNQEENKQFTETYDDMKIIENQGNASDQTNEMAKITTESFPMEWKVPSMETDDISKKFIIYAEIIGILLLIIAIQTVLIIWYRWRTNPISNTETNFDNGEYVEPINEYEEVNNFVIERESNGYSISNTVSNDNNGGYIEPTNEYEEINDVVIERESSGYIVPLPAL